MDETLQQTLNIPKYVWCKTYRQITEDLFQHLVDSEKTRYRCWKKNNSKKGISSKWRNERQSNPRSFRIIGISKYHSIKVNLEKFVGLGRKQKTKSTFVQMAQRKTIVDDQRLAQRKTIVNDQRQPTFVKRFFDYWRPFR